MTQNEAIVDLLTEPLSHFQIIERLVDYDLYPTAESLKVILCNLQKKRLITSERTKCPECGKHLTLYKRTT